MLRTIWIIPLSLSVSAVANPITSKHPCTGQRGSLGLSQWTKQYLRKLWSFISSDMPKLISSKAAVGSDQLCSSNLRGDSLGEPESSSYFIRVQFDLDGHNACRSRDRYAHALSVPS